MKCASIILTLLLVAGATLADQVSEFIEKGKQNLANNDGELALSNLNAAIKLDPKSIEAYRVRARVFLVTKQNKEATNDLTTVIQLDPQNATNYCERAIVFNLLDNRSLALIDLDDAIRLDSNFFAAHFLRGIIYDDTGDYQKALSDETEAIRLDPKASKPYYYRGRIRGRMGNYDQAIADLNRAIELNPKDPANYIGRGAVEVETTHFNDAIADCEKALSLPQKDKLFPPDEYLCFFTRARAYIGKGNYNAAIRDFDHLISLNDQDAHLYANRGHLLAGQGSYASAIADCEKAIELGPRFANGYNNLAWILATCPEGKFRNGSKALELANKACELTDWKDPYCLGTIAAAYAETGDFASAIKWQKKGLELGLSKEAAAEAQRILKFYEDKKPYHEDKSVVREESRPGGN